MVLPQRPIALRPNFQSEWGRGWHGQAPACAWAGSTQARANKFAHATRLSFFACFVLSLCANDLANGQEPRAIIAGRYVAPDGSLKSNAAIVLADGKIESIVPENDYQAAGPVVRHTEAVVCPGLLDVRSQISAYGNAIETANAIDPGASAIDSVDWQHRDFQTALRVGITTVMITPSENNLICGAATVVKTIRTAGRDSVLRREGPLMFALGSTVWSYDRAPTSRIGSLAMLREALNEAEQGRGHQRLQDFLNGRLDGVVVCEEAMDVSAALRTFAERHLTAAIAYTGDEHDLADELVRHSRAVILGPFTFDMPRRTLSTAAVYSLAGVPVIFTAQMPRHSGDALRITAALAVNHGLNPAQARQAITVLPATLAGVSERVGSIHPGMDADLVVFSDDPLRLDARVLEVYVNGLRVYSADLNHAKLAGGE